MPKAVSTYIFKPKKKRPGVHSKNASRGQSGYKKKYRGQGKSCLLYTSPSPRDRTRSRMPSSA